MERDTKHKIIIEFNGLPGCGKTTIADALQKQLNKANITSCKNYYKASLHRHLKSLYLEPRYWKIIIKIARFSSSIQHGSRMSRVLLIVNFLRMYHNFLKNSSTNCLIVDQGVVQSLISLFHKLRIAKIDETDAVLETFGFNYLPIILVNCDVRETTSSERIITRQQNGCRVESMDECERMKTLSVQASNLKDLRNRIRHLFSTVSSVDIDCEQPVDKSAQILCDLIASHLELK